MKLVLGSDFHGLLPKVPPCDILVMAGDVLPEDDQDVFIEKILKPWLEEAPADEIVATWGNHDDRPFRVPFSLPWRLLRDESAVVKGLKFYGTPWCLPVGRWAWQVPEDILKYIYSLVPDDVDIFVSHTPPYGICDLVDPKPEKNRPSENVGSRELRKRIDELSQLKLLVCGHIHEARGVSGIVHNVSCVRKRLKTESQYTLRENPWTVVEL